MSSKAHFNPKSLKWIISLVVMIVLSAGFHILLYCCLMVFAVSGTNIRITTIRLVTALSSFRLPDITIINYSITLFQKNSSFKTYQAIQSLFFKNAVKIFNVICIIHVF